MKRLTTSKSWLPVLQCLYLFIQTDAIFRRALLAQHETRRAEFMNNFGSFQTSMTLGRKALQKIQHYELRLKKERMHGWVSRVFTFLSIAIIIIIKKAVLKTCVIYTSFLYAYGFMVSIHMFVINSFRNVFTLP